MPSDGMQASPNGGAADGGVKRPDVIHGQGITRREATRRLTIAGWAMLGPRTGAWFVPWPEHRQPGSSPELEKVLERVRGQHKLPGLAAAVVRGQRDTVTGVAGVRRWSHQAMIQLRDRFHIASCTKSWTATLSAAAVQRGQLSWRTTLAEGLPSLASRMRREYAAVTLEQLLAHEAKLPPYTQPSARRVEEMQGLTGSSSEQRLAFLGQVLAESPNHATGDGAYSNAGYAAVGALLESATGCTWEDLIRRELAEPLELHTVGFGYPATADAPNHPHGHTRRGVTMVELPLDDGRQLPVCLWPAGAVHCSIGDLAKYAADHLNGLFARPALLPSAYYEHLHRRRGDSVFTLGWGIARDQRWGVTHFGAGSGGWFFVRIVILPEHDAAVVIASNSGDAGPATRELWPQLVQQFGTG